MSKSLIGIDTVEPDRTGKMVGERDWRKMTARERLAVIPRIYLFTPQISSILTRLNHAFFNPRGLGPGRGILLYGPHSVGKSALLRQFESAHPGVPGAQVPQRPVIVTTPTSRLDAAGLAEAIVRDARWPLRSPFSGGKLPEVGTDHVLRTSGTSMLFFNRANFLAPSGLTIERSAIPFMLNLIDRGAATVVLVGDPSLPMLIDASSDLIDRFWTRLRLDPIPFAGTKGCQWTSIVVDFEKRLPFEPGEMCVDDMPHRLHAAAKARLKGLARLIEAAAMVALYETKPSATKLLRKHFRQAYADHRPGEPNPFDRDSISLPRRRRLHWRRHSLRPRSPHCGSTTGGPNHDH